MNVHEMIRQTLSTADDYMGAASAAFDSGDFATATELASRAHALDDAAVRLMTIRELLCGSGGVSQHG